MTQNSAHIMAQLTGGDYLLKRQELILASATVSTSPTESLGAIVLETSGTVATAAQSITLVAMTVNTTPTSVHGTTATAVPTDIVPTASAMPTTAAAGSGLATTTLVAILVPVCFLLACTLLVAYLLYIRRQRLKETKIRAWPRVLVHRHDTRRTLARNVEIDSKEKQELEAVERAQELAGRGITRSPLARDVELDNTEKRMDAIFGEQELDTMKRSRRSSRSTIGSMFRAIARSASRAHAPADKNWDQTSPREYAELEAHMTEAMRGEANADEELRKLRIQQATALAEREVAEEREAQLRKLIREREEFQNKQKQSN